MRSCDRERGEDGTRHSYAPHHEKALVWQIRMRERGTSWVLCARRRPELSLEVAVYHCQKAKQRRNLVRSPEEMREDKFWRARS